MDTAEILQGTYDPGLVVLSLVIAMSASYVALEMGGRTTATSGRGRLGWLAAGSISMGIGIWSMHYIGMLAFSLPVPVMYDLPGVFASLLAAMLASAVALLVVSRKNVGNAMFLIGGIVMGGGIASMHYIGMAAMRMSASHSYSMSIVALSIVIAVVVSIAALFITFHLRDEVREFSPRKFGGAAIMGFAIASMHYTAMAGVKFTSGSMPGMSHEGVANAVSISSLGTSAIALTTIMILGVVALLAIFNRRFAAQAVALQFAEERTQLMQVAKEAAEATSEAKTTFLATMSHEIRTPMNAIMGLQELLSLSRLSTEQREWLRLMRQSSKDLLHLIDDILDFSKIEAGKLDINNESTAIHELIQGVSDTFSVLARDRGLKLQTHVAPAVPQLVMIDTLRLRQILTNLISNAIKFTHEGSIHVRVGTFDRDNKRMQFEITDTGIGMSPEAVSRCGEPFQQADAGMARRYGGSGLGLAICKRLCELMKGELQVQSVEHVGTRITVELPFEPIAAEPKGFRPEATQSVLLSAPLTAPTVEDAIAARRLILVVDDHPTNRRLLVQQLEWLGYACESYGDGRTALSRYLERLASRTPYAMTITDCQMPGMDGYELGREIRRAEVGTGHRTALLAFTADTSRSMTELTTSIGFDAVLSKPVSLTTLQTNLEKRLPAVKSSTRLPVSVDRELTITGPLQEAAVREEFFIAHDEDLEMLRSGERENDTATIARAAHRIRGAARMIGLHPLAEAAAALSQTVAENDWAKISMCTRQIYTATAELYAEFGQEFRETEAVGSAM